MTAIDQFDQKLLPKTYVDYDCTKDIMELIESKKFGHVDGLVLTCDGSYFIDSVRKELYKIEEDLGSGLENVIYNY